MAVSSKSSRATTGSSTTESTLISVLQLSKDVGAALDNVPYIQSVAGVLLQILKMREDVLYLKEFSRELIDLVAARALPILKALEGIRAETAAELYSLKTDLETYRQLLEDIRSELALLATRRTFYVILHRDQIKGNLDQLKRRLDDFHGTFNVSRLTDITQNVIKLAEVTQDVKRITEDTKALVEAQTILDTGSGFMFKESLPPPRKAFIGREEERRYMLHLLKGSPNPHIAIVGPGGMGKTALALSLLHDPDITNVYNQKRYFVSCEQVTTVRRLLDSIANVVGIPHRDRGPFLQKTVLQYLAEHPILLCLDNFEDLWDAPGERQDLDDLFTHLDAIPRLGVILTTRVGERPTGMSWSDSETDELRPLQEVDAVALFEYFAKCTDARIAGLVNAVECLPLAIELLARQVGRDSMDAFMEIWLDEGIKMLDNGGGLDTRRTSVTTTIRLSLNTLRVANHPSAAMVLRLLTVLPHGLAASIVKQAQGFLPSTFLLRQSLRVLCSASLMYKDSSDRYRILAPIRQYAEEFIELQLDLMRGLSLTFAHIVNTDPDPRRSSHFHATLSELSNAESVLLTGLSLMHGTLEQEQIILAIVNLMYWRGYVRGHASLDLIRAALHHSSTPILRAKCQLALGVVLSSLRDSDAAEQSFLSALQIFEDLGDAGNQGVVWRQLSYVRNQRGHRDGALDALNRSLSLFIEAEDHNAQASVLVLLGRWLSNTSRRRYQNAAASLHWALRKSQKYGDPVAVADGYRSLGMVYLDCGRLDDAEPHFIQALEVYEEGEGSGAIPAGWCHARLGEIYMAKRRYAEAQKSFWQAVKLFREVGDGGSEGHVRLLLGQMFVKRYHVPQDDDEDEDVPLNGLGEAAREFESAFELCKKQKMDCQVRQAENCLHFLEMPVIDVCFDIPAPTMWEPLAESYPKFIYRVLGIKVLDT